MIEEYQMDHDVHHNPIKVFYKNSTDIISLTADPVTICTGASGSI